MVTATSIPNTYAPQKLSRFSLNWEEARLRPSWAGTIALILGLGVAAWVPSGNEASAVARQASWIVLISLVANIVFDWRISLRNLVRVDLVAMGALYFLTLFEFLFAQEDFNLQASIPETKAGVNLVLLGLLGMALGRHLLPPGRAALGFAQRVRLNPHLVFWGFIVLFIINNWFMMKAVSFNIFEWVDQLIAPRFSQSWQRSRFGGGMADALNSLFSYIGMAVPPVAGLILAKRRHFNAVQLVVVVVLFLFTIFVVISSGTRNLLASTLGSFLFFYVIAQPRINWIRLGIVAAVSVLFFVAMSDHMLRFREMGMRQYVENEAYKTVGIMGFFATRSDEVHIDEGFLEGKGFYVDYNLLNIIGLQRVFPEAYDYLGFNLPWVAITKFIPRAIWPGKPEGLKVGIEEALGAEGLTISCTFVGEGYMTAGPFGVLLFGLAFGVAAAWFNRLGGSNCSLISQLIFAVGLGVLVLSMRSVMFTTTMLLACFFLSVVALFLYQRQQSS